ncbi:hypothetical protein AVI51_13265 [Piscirickettsia salmonis]|uniref:Sporulation initiation inhibitor protein soj n=2 Tax=Piscirickettsia salmonis TaxID=1238 RepID=A0A9Q5V7M9_PISSA|nr:AAA family ATPase [Piscirickettsia salmonis]ALA24006.1 chromosome partitioning protein ParA [Piscirickettsia salmonis]APS47776.1 hypothetical protein AVI49_09195 [Piscirickettsia salmonis]APS51722.1 hypothetical protein AVI50_13385 [Piscirickettsia salmonis]APS54940.1 hypothetical protein AVI51_13265 [Piscirickettsia salmonis]APS58061.1 hypothetical protein AVI52_12945 [Piscirickettsia salmonis]
MQINDHEIFGVDDAAELMQESNEIGTKVLERLLAESIDPENNKKLKRWGITEAADMIGRSPQHIRINEGKGKRFGLPDKDENGKRVYSLDRINKIRDIEGTRYLRPKGSDCMITSIANFKGGVAKTTTTIHLAQKLALDGLKCLVIDLDPQATLSFLFGLNPDIELSEEDTINLSLTEDPSLIHNVIRPTYTDGLDLIPSNLSLQDTEFLLMSDNINKKLGNSISRLKSALEFVKDQYDVILIDCPPNNGSLTLNALYAVTGLIVPVLPAITDYASYIRFAKTLSNLFNSREGNKSLKYFRILITRHTKTTSSIRAENLIRHNFGDFVMSNSMINTVDVQNATSEIKTIYERKALGSESKSHKRAIEAVNAVNDEIINAFKSIWRTEANANMSKIKSAKKKKVVKKSSVIRKKATNKNAVTKRKVK